MIGLLQMHVRILLHDSVPHPHVWLHRPKGVFLLHEVNAHVLVPVVGAGLVEELEVLLLAQHLQSEEDEARREVGMLSDHFIVDFIEGPHVLPLVVDLDHIPQAVIFGQLAEEGSELHALVAILDEF